jgi:LPXTG-site transpeptidase (sortase) family protein
MDLAGNKLNNGMDHLLTFTIQVLSAVESLPTTGFAPGRLTDLNVQPLDKAYQSLGDLWLEFPTQNIKAPITGVSWVAKEWDLTWLNQQVGWLEGTAFPTWNGNTVLTAHAYRPDGLPGPFAYLNYLKYGDTIIVHYNGLAYHYAVRSQTVVSPTNINLLAKSEKLDWLTLITCQQFDETSGSYLYRRIVRAVLIKVVND